MKHVSEEQLVEHFYGEGSARVEAHMKSCDQCARALADLDIDLAEFRSPQLLVRDDSYGDRVWQSIAPSLPAYPKRDRGWLNRIWQEHRPLYTAWGRGLSFATGFALLLAGAFFAGRLWEQKKQVPIAIAPKPVQPQQKQQPRQNQQPQRVVVVVLGDHLDRSERLLVELKHADADNAEMIAPLRDEARTLLVANHTLRQKATVADDPELATALKQLDSLLGELANRPGGLDASGLAKLQHEMKSDRLLFEVRVLRSRTPELQMRSTIQASGGTV